MSTRSSPSRGISRPPTPVNSRSKPAPPSTPTSKLSSTLLTTRSGDSALFSTPPSSYPSASPSSRRRYRRRASNGTLFSISSLRFKGDRPPSVPSSPLDPRILTPRSSLHLHCTRYIDLTLHSKTVEPELSDDPFAREPMHFYASDMSDLSDTQRSDPLSARILETERVWRAAGEPWLKHRRGVGSGGGDCRVQKVRSDTALSGHESYCTAASREYRSAQNGSPGDMDSGNADSRGHSTSDSSDAFPGFTGGGIGEWHQRSVTRSASLGGSSHFGSDGHAGSTRLSTRDVSPAARSSGLFPRSFTSWQLDVMAQQGQHQGEVRLWAPTIVSQDSRQSFAAVLSATTTTAADTTTIAPLMKDAPRIELAMVVEGSGRLSISSTVLWEEAKARIEAEAAGGASREGLRKRREDRRESTPTPTKKAPPSSSQKRGLALCQRVRRRPSFGNLIARAAKQWKRWVL